MRRAPAPSSQLLLLAAAAAADDNGGARRYFNRSPLLLPRGLIALGTARRRLRRRLLHPAKDGVGHRLLLEIHVLLGGRGTRGGLLLSRREEASLPENPADGES